MKKIPNNLQVWIEARGRHRLTDAQVLMARELGMNPRKLGKIDNHKQQPWKLPLPKYIEHLYRKRFGKNVPDKVLSIEKLAKEIAKKKAERKARKEATRKAESATAEEANVRPAGENETDDPIPF